MKKLLLKTTGALVLTAAVLAGTSSQWAERGILVSFNQETDSDIYYQVFFTRNEQEIFNKQETVAYKASADMPEVKILLPEKHISRFRLDHGTIPGQVTISNLKLTGDQVVELSDFNEFRYSPDVEDKVIEDDRVTIISNKEDPYMVSQRLLDLNECIFIDKGKAGVIGVVTFLIGFVMLGFFFRKKAKK